MIQEIDNYLRGLVDNSKLLNASVSTSPDNVIELKVQPSYRMAYATLQFDVNEETVAWNFTPSFSEEYLKHNEMLKEIREQVVNIILGKEEQCNN